MTALLTLLFLSGAGQTTAPSALIATSKPSVESPEARAEMARIQTLLGGIRDNVFSFDDPAFYHLCAYVAAFDDPRLVTPIGDGELVEWRLLLERPSDYRGKLVAVEGVLQQRFAFNVHDRPGVATLYEADLSRPGSQSFCTVVTTDNILDVPHRARVRVRGYFVKVRAYQTTGKDTGAGPLLVARNLQVVSEAPPGGGRLIDWSDHRNTILGATLVLAIAWIYLRRKARAVVAKTGRHRPTRPEAPPSDRDYDWLTAGDDDSRSPQ